MTTTLFVPSTPAPRVRRPIRFTEHLASARRSLTPGISGSLRHLGQIIWFVPALALAVLVWALNRSNRKSELLESVRFVLQALSAVTSPFKIAFTVFVIAAVWFAGSLHPSRLTAVITFLGVGAVSVAEVVVQGHVGELGGLAIVLLSAIATNASLVWAARSW